MRRFCYVVAGFGALIFANVVFAQIGMFQVPGSSPQTARPGQGFPNPVGVLVTDNSLVPLPGVPVTWALPGYWIFAQPINVNTIVVNTDANGVSMIPSPGLWAIADPGVYQVTANVQGPIPGETFSELFDLTVAGAPPASTLNVSGAGQAIPAGGLSQPFVIQIVDAGGVPVPYPIAYFVAPVGSPPAVNASFNGASVAVVDGDVNGIVTSPPLLAGSVSGLEYLQAFLFVAPGNQLGNYEPMPFTITSPPPVTLSPLAGSTPQSTCHFCFFPVPVGVVARHPDGSPARDVTVTFTNDPTFIEIPGQGDVATLDVLTGADGIARPSSPIAPAGYEARVVGSTTVTASSAAALNQVTFNLSSSGKSQNRIELLSGSNQVAQVGGHFAPLVVRASDDNGPVPNAAVEFLSLQVGAGVTFNGLGSAYVPADAQGIARSPVPVANSVAGAPLVQVLLETDPAPPGFGGWEPGVSFGLQSTTGNPGYGLLRPWQVPPLSLAFGSSTVIPFAMQVLDLSGNPVANAPVTFTTDSSCGTFNGSRTVTATSDASGIATAPPFKGLRAVLACATSAQVQGQSRDLTMHVFDPSKVQAAISPNFVLVHYLDAVYGLSLTFTEHGRAVHVAQASVSVLPHVGASLSATPVFDVFDNGSIFIGLTPNQRAGTYLVQVTTIGGQRFLVPVVQVP